MKPKVLAAAIAALLLVGGGAFALTRLMSASEDEALAYVPAGALAYTNVFIRPSNSQKMALDDFLQKLPGVDSTDEAIEKVTELLDEALAEDGFDYEKDVDPWLGDQIAAFMTPGATVELPNFALLVESTDDDAALDFVAKTAEKDDVELEDKTYEGETYQMAKDSDERTAAAVLDGFLVVGTEDAVKQVIDTRASEETLGTEERFVDATEPLRDDWLGLFYVDTAGLAEAMTPEGTAASEQTAALEAFGLQDYPPQAAILYVTSDSAVFEASTGIPEGAFGELVALSAGRGLVPELPADSWLALGVPELGRTIDGLFDLLTGLPGFESAQLESLFYAETGLRLQDDVLSWMGDAGVFVQGTNPVGIGGGVVVGSTDADKTGRLVDKLSDLLAEQGVPTRPFSQDGAEGFTIEVPGIPAPVFVLGGDRFSVTYGRPATDALAKSGETLEGSEAFRAAQEAVGDDFNVAFFLDLDAIAPLVDAAVGFTPGADDYEKEWKPWLDVGEHFVYASKLDGDHLVQKLLVGIE